MEREIGAEAQASGPLVSVGMPAYNRPEGLRRALNCVVSQTYRNLDIIVSDDCSPDDRVEAVAREFMRSDGRIRFFRQPHNLRPNAHFKFLLGQARGPYFFFACDDDEWAPDFVALCLEHLDRAGTVMTDARRSVRTRGLLRPTPPVRVSAANTPFENARAFLADLKQNYLFSGIHRVETLEPFLRERMFDYYDSFFSLRQILTYGLHVVPRVCFTIGIDTEEQVLKPDRPRAGAVYEYLPLFRGSARAILSCRGLSITEKTRLLYQLSYAVLNEFAYFEQSARPWRARLAAGILRFLRPLRWLFRVPLPAPPPVMPLPERPADVCYMFLPAAELESVECVRALLEDALSQLRAKQSVIAGLKEEVVRVAGRSRTLGQRWRAVARRFRRASRRTRPAPRELPATAGLEELRSELGVTLLALEDREARIQALVRKLDRARRRLDAA